LKLENHLADKDEPFFYMAFVLKGTAKQYLDLLRYAKTKNGAKIIYQNRSLTYLYITNKDPKKNEPASTESVTELSSTQSL